MGAGRGISRLIPNFDVFGSRRWLAGTEPCGSQLPRGQGVPRRLRGSLVIGWPLQARSRPSCARPSPAPLSWGPPASIPASPGLCPFLVSFRGCGRWGVREGSSPRQWERSPGLGRHLRGTNFHSFPVGSDLRAWPRALWKERLGPLKLQKKGIYLSRYCGLDYHHHSSSTALNFN